MATTAVSSEGGFRSRLMAMMSYLGILCFVPLVMNGSDEFVYFHAKQGLVIWMWGVLAIFALHLPAIGNWLFAISALAVLVLSIAGLVAVALNKAWRLPFISYVAEQL